MGLEFTRSRGPDSPETGQVGERGRRSGALAWAGGRARKGVTRTSERLEHSTNPSISSPPHPLLRSCRSRGPLSPPQHPTPRSRRCHGVTGRRSSIAPPPPTGHGRAASAVGARFRRQRDPAAPPPTTARGPARLASCATAADGAGGHRLGPTALDDATVALPGPCPAGAWPHCRFRHRARV